MTVSTTHAIDIEVRYAETDQMGVVHHANYLIWFELARTHHCMASGIAYADIETAGYLLMVTQATLKYRQGARYGDTLEISCTLARLVSRGMEFRYEVRRGDELLATGETHHLWVRRADSRPCRMPTQFAPYFEGREGTAS